MKLIIIEGTDNTGKDTLISKLLEKFPTSTIIHCGKPCSKQYSGNEQDALFEVYANNIVNGAYGNTHVIIMNRSHIGEYVYGVLYRGRDKEDVKKMIWNIDNYLKEYCDVYYVQLLCSSEFLLAKNEDEKSLSNGNAEKIEIEKSKFLEIFNESKLNKKLVWVNEDDHFRPVNDIFNEVWKFVNK